MNNNILLINPAQSFKKSSFEDERKWVPPLGLLYLNEYLLRAGFNSIVLDMDSGEYSLNELLNFIREKNISVVGITVYTRTRKMAYYLSKKIKQEFPNIYIMFGGAHCTIFPEDARKNSEADVIVRNEAELEIVDIVKNRKKGIINCKSPSDLNKVHFPRRNIDFLSGNYGNVLDIKVSKNPAPLSSSRGCPFNCSFCSRVDLLKFRKRRPENVVKEIKQLYEQGYDCIIFTDDNFSTIPKRAMKIARLVKENNIEMDFVFQGRVNTDEDFWKTMSSAGFNIVCIGIEHIKPEIIKYFNKYHDPSKWREKVAETFELINKHNVLAVGSFILGAPMETREDAFELINFLDEQNVDFKSGNELLYSYGTKLWNDAVKQGLFSPNIMHMPVSRIYPEKKEYLNEVFDIVWKKNIKGVPRILKKLFFGTKKDKITPILSMSKLFLKKWKNMFFNPPVRGYGRKEEFDFTS